jgi:hypothetical protein
MSLSFHLRFGRSPLGGPTNASMASATSALRMRGADVDLQESPPALSVLTTLAARPLFARSLLRTLRLALRDGGGRAGTGSGTPSITLAFAPASRSASMPLISSMLLSICSSLIDLTPPECSTCSHAEEGAREPSHNQAGFASDIPRSPCGRAPQNRAGAPGEIFG